MKKFLLILILGLFSFKGTAQDPDPELFQTWYLYYVQATDLSDEYDISQIEPAIQPYITISEDLSFNGEGACNTFDGVYDHLGANNMQSITYNNTTDDCEIQVHNSVEGGFFSFMQNGFWYEIGQSSDGLTFYLFNPLMGHAILKDYPLSVSENNLSNFIIYPTPVSDKLYISSENNDIERLTIYSTSGQKVLEQHTNNKTIDVSSLSKGMYFLEISTSEGKSIKKFIKK